MTLARYVAGMLLIALGWLSVSSPSHASNDPSSLQAVRVSSPPRLDGTLGDPAWQKAPPARGFHQYEPYNGRPATFDTEVRVLYDDHALYIGARLFDAAPDSILREMGQRNAGHNLNADRFYFDINPFNDGRRGFRFQVSASGVQTDSDLSGGGVWARFGMGDVNWDAVWFSAVGIDEAGWIVEMRIPYSALRFPRGEVQEWGINFWREIRRKRELSSWNYVDRRVGDSLAFMGTLTGLEDISPPARLAFYPYLSNYMQKNGYERGWAHSLTGGIDGKFGLTPGFTMDVTLVPDFGQVQSDARVLNLSPYEIKYNENRQFFTEGTDLFGKADLFYSRRIGTRPRDHGAARREQGEHEIVYENPLETRLINATKLSGRTSGGLGIGFFNAMTAASEAALVDTLTGLTRPVSTQPFTNYNLVVFDQSLRNNSHLSLINTNVAGSAPGYVANVTGADFRFLDSSNMYRVSGSGALSRQHHRDAPARSGYKYDLRLGRFGGTWQYHYNRTVISDTYDQNDLGFLRRNNRIDDSLSFGYNIFEPSGRLLNLRSSVSLNYARLFEPNTFTNLQWQYHLWMLFDTRLHLILRSAWSPRGERDYFEPRVPGRFYRTDGAFNHHLRYSTDRRRRLYWSGHFSYSQVRSAERQDGYGFNLQPTFRASDRLTASYGFEYNESRNEIGYVRHTQADSVYFGRRRSPTITSTYRTTYIFTSDLSVDFNLRHYWSRVAYDGEYYLLASGGRLEAFDHDLAIADINYNAFTIDLLVTWHFAPGSQMTLAWKNVIDSRLDDIEPRYFDNLRQVWSEPQINSLSVKLLYYLDYAALQRLSRRGGR